MQNISKKKYSRYSVVESLKIGKNTKIWQYSIILSEAKIGKNCNICSHVFIENKVEIGNNVTIKNSALIYDGTHIGDDCFIGPNVVFTNDKNPKSKKKFKIKKTTVHKGASIGAGSIVLPGITIGKNSCIGAGSVVTKDVRANTTVAGNPAKKLRNDT